MMEARFYEKLDEGRVQCHLCPKECIISPGKRGFCRARENREGKLFATYYGRVSSVAMDPIEKKPLFHFYPGHDILSLGNVGCNFACLYCQNWQISQADAPTQPLNPESAVALASRYNSMGIAYTYAEPMVWFEYVLDTAKLAHDDGLKNVLVTNGYINEEPLRQLLPFIDAMNIDLKSIRENFYEELCKGSLSPVLRTLEIAKEHCHIEVTNLIIPTLNDSEEDIHDLVRWVAENLGEDTPLHFSRYFPQYKMKIPPTPVETLLRAREIGKEYLNYVYLGNVLVEGGEDTICPSCGAVVVRRVGYTVDTSGLEGNKCKACGYALPIVA